MTQTPREHAESLIKKKEAIEAQLQSQLAILEAHSCTMDTPLVDSEGFPRDDIDIYAVRGPRQRIIELRNDYSAVMKDIGEALQVALPPSSDSTEQSIPSPVKPFARVDGVAPNSPAAEAGLLREDLLVRFGQLTSQSFKTSSFQPLADVVADHENKSIGIKVLRAGEPIFLSLTPRKGWGGRGMLGCHIVPYSPSS
ncbi:hypothetical protein C8J56DRAFT_910923 [Mycena floridula]|nr:hypothetical protein C8J56DRAFT_910923 [Mycena floridula]